MRGPKRTTSPFFRDVLQVGTILGALALILIIIWIDISTTLWQEMVILSGLAAGLVSFLLTTVFINRFHQRQLEARWEPVTHMALTSLLHQLADEKHSDLSRGAISPRFLTIPSAIDSPSLHTQLEKLRHIIFKEQNHLTSVLGRWSEFLTSTGNNTDILRTAAELALQLEQVRDSALETEQRLAATNTTTLPHDILTELTQEINSCNDQLSSLIDSLKTRKSEHSRI